jgi:hypothetical protein
MSVSLAATDGRVIGGGVAGLLVAASPVQVNPFFSLSRIIIMDYCSMFLKIQFFKKKPSILF